MAKRNSSSRNLSSLTDQVRSNLPNFLLGLTILIVFVLLSSLYMKKGQKQAPQPQAKRRPLIEIIMGKKQEESKKKEQRKHVVKEGETLWIISEQYYGSGYNAYDIAKANNLESADVIEVEQVLIIPEVSSKMPTKGDVGTMMTEKVTIPGSEYVVKEGDSLWTIARGAYGDGNAWTRIAKANNLGNPDIINPDQKLILPR